MYKSKSVANHSAANRSSLARYVTIIWLVGTLVLLPIDVFQLPMNMSLADCWILLALPVIWLSFVRGKRIIGLSFVVPMWLILVSGLASALAASHPSTSLVVILKEVFVFVWFITLAALFPGLDARDLRLALLVWMGVAILHGALIVAQFLFPSLWQVTSGLVGRSTGFADYRPSGLFTNANKAACFQLYGFVPLLLANLARKTTMILGILLLLTMLATGSMGATIAFLTGLTVAMVVLLVSGRLISVVKALVQSAIIVALVGVVMYLVVSHNVRFQEHLAYILLGRSERSSGGRFDLWQRGFDVYLDHGAFLWGIGPENFRFVDGEDKQLHNDLLAFSVERGLFGTLGLLLFAALAVGRAAYVVRAYIRHPDRAHLGVVVFPAALVATIVESFTHQTFHFHELWLVLALQEAMLFKLAADQGANEPHTGPVATSLLSAGTVECDGGTKLQHAD